LELSTDLLLDSELHLAVQTFKEKVVAMPQQPASTCMSGHTTGAFDPCRRRIEWKVNAMAGRCNSTPGSSEAAIGGASRLPQE
jgi:hypothetical protein